MEHPALLELLDALIANDRGAPGFRGTISIVVRTPEREHIWQAVFAEKSSAAFVDAVAPNTQAVLLLGEREANLILETGEPPQPPRLFVGAGDRALFSAFKDRYLSPKSFIDVRAGAKR